MIIESVKTLNNVRLEKRNLKFLKIQGWEYFTKSENFGAKVKFLKLELGKFFNFGKFQFWSKPPLKASIITHFFPRFLPIQKLSHRSLYFSLSPPPPQPMLHALPLLTHSQCCLPCCSHRQATTAATVSRPPAETSLLAVTVDNAQRWQL